MAFEKRTAYINGFKVFPSIHEGLKQMAFENDGIAINKMASVLLTRAINTYLKKKEAT